MLRTLPQALALLMAMLATAIPATAQELTDKQVRLLEALPPVEQIVAALPERKNELDATVERRVVLAEFSDMVFYIARNVPAGELRDRANAYHDAVEAEFRRILQYLRVRRDDPSAWVVAGRTTAEVWGRLHGDEIASRQVFRELFSTTLDGELREHALDWFDGRVRRQDEPAFIKEARAWVKDLPEPWPGIVSKISDIPDNVWISLCLVWLVLGFATRTVPFRLLPDNPWILQRARKRLAMNHGHVVVVDVQEREEIQQHITVNANRNSIAAPAHVHITRKVTATLFVKDHRGKESSFDLVNQRFDVRIGHQLLVVTDARSGSLLFLYNHDMQTVLRLTELTGFVKMRPWLLIPLAGLALFYGLAFEGSPDVKAAIIVVTPIVYLVFMKLVNLTRRERFMSKFVPRLLEAAGPPPELNSIGNSEFSIRRA